MSPIIALCPDNVPDGSLFVYSTKTVLVGPSLKMYTVHIPILDRGSFTRSASCYECQGAHAHACGHTITLPEEETSAFENMLQYLYSGSVAKLALGLNKAGKNKTKVAGAMRMVLSTYMLATKYEIQDLQSAIVKLLRHNTQGTWTGYDLINKLEKAGLSAQGDMLAGYFLRKLKFDIRKQHWGLETEGMMEWLRGNGKDGVVRELKASLDDGQMSVDPSFGVWGEEGGLMGRFVEMTECEKQEGRKNGNAKRKIGRGKGRKK